MFRRQLIIDGGLLTLLVLTIVVTTSLYVSAEHNFYWWVDWWYKTIQVADAVRESPQQLLSLILQSLKTERNSLYTLPLVPFILAFGDSRLTYELGLAIVYLLPFSLTIGAISTHLLSKHSRSVFWSTTFLCLLVPVTWIPTFLGVPDTGGALLIGLAALVYLQDVTLKRWWRIGLVGFLIAAATLLRRHFIYGGVALLGAMTLQALVFFFAQVRSHSAWRNLLSYSIRLSLIAITILFVLMAIAGDFTSRALTTDYIGLYASWSLPVSDMVERYARFYGWATWLLVAIGFSAGTLTRILSLTKASLIYLSGLLILIEWLLLLRYGNVFYSLHTTPLVVLGLAAFFWTSWFILTGKVRILIVSIASCYLVCNLVIGLTPVGNFSSPLRPLFALNMPPLRTDYDEAVRLVRYLRELTPHQEPIYVVGHQRLQLNTSLIKAVQGIIYRDRNILNTLIVPQVDSEDFYPLESILQAEYVVVPNYIPEYPGSITKVPVVGEWLPPQEHDVVRVVLNIFTQRWEIAQDFKRLPVQFMFDRGTVVSIYQRTRPTSLTTAIQTFHTMQQQIGKKPGSQLDWLALSELRRPIIIKNSDQIYQLWTRSSDLSQTTSFLYINPLLGQINLTGKLNFLNKQCLSATLQLSVVNQQGEIVNSTEAVYSPEEISSFNLSVKGNPTNYLLLNVINNCNKDNINSYSLEIDQLTVFDQRI